MTYKTTDMQQLTELQILSDTIYTLCILITQVLWFQGKPVYHLQQHIFIKTFSLILLHRTNVNFQLTLLPQDINMELGKESCTTFLR